MTLENAVLYHKVFCPYCNKVLTFMQENGIELPLADTAEPENNEKLEAIGGKSQVPCLVMGDKALYESDDIIAFLKKEFGI